MGEFNTARQENTIIRLEKECGELRRKIEAIKKLAQSKAGHKLMQVAGPFRELLNLLK